jgi:aryl-alcohol dehydrogenase-like predicted oxidoreductase
MKQRSVGSTGEVVGAVGLGGLALSSTYHPTNDEDALALMHRAFDIGVTHLDTADAYGKGPTARDTTSGSSARPSDHGETPYTWRPSSVSCSRPKGSGS